MESLHTVVYGLSTITPDLRDRVGNRALYLRDLLNWNRSRGMAKTVTVQSGQVVAAVALAALGKTEDPTIETLQWDWLRDLDRIPQQSLRLSLSLAWDAHPNLPQTRSQLATWEELLPHEICLSHDRAIQETTLDLWTRLASRQWKILWNSLGISPANLPIALIIQPEAPGPQSTGWITQYSRSGQSRDSSHWHLRGDRLSVEQQHRLKTWVSQLPDLWGMDLSLEWVLDQDNRFWIVTVIPGEPLLQETTSPLEPYQHRSKSLLPIPRSELFPSANLGQPPRPAGIAHVLTHRLDHPLPQGTIAVMKELDPAWIPFLQAVSGIIVEQPGINHHGVILARELGIPMMLGIENATQDIQTGDRLVMSHDALMPRPTAQLPTPDPTHPRRLPLLVNLSQVSRLGEVLPHITRQEIDGLGLIRSEWLLLPEVANAQDLEEPMLWRDLLRSRLAHLTEQLNQIKPLPTTLLPTHNLYYRCLPHPKNSLTLAPLQTELSALRELQEITPYPLRLILPFVQTLEDFTLHFQEVKQYNFAANTEIWMMAEVPAVVYLLDEFIEAGAQGIVIGLNDLTAWTLGIDRTAPLFYTSMAAPHRAVIQAVQQILASTQRHGIPCWLVLSCWSEAWVQIACNLGITGLMVERSDWQQIAIALTSSDNLTSPRTK